jgi:quinohemoprotein ethanol dehydrogenase
MRNAAPRSLTRATPLAYNMSLLLQKRVHPHGALRYRFVPRENGTMWKPTAWIGACVLLLSSCRAFAADAGAVGAGNDWTAHNAGADESAYSPLHQIDAANVDRLGLAWSMDLPGESSLEATPLAVDGILYFTGSYGTVFAVEGASGKLVWKYAPETWRNHPSKMAGSFAVNRGAAFADGRVFSASSDGRLFALDAKSGKLLWSVQTLPADSPLGITGAPRTFNGKVIIGNSGAEYGPRGYVTAYSAADGEQLWRFFTVPGTPEENRGDPPMERAAATWHGPYWKTGTGGEVWDGITFDPEMNRIYIGTANGSPFDRDIRSPGGGDNLYVASIVALDADTGKYIWHYQVVPGDSWDYDTTQQMIIADLIIGGQPRKVLMQAPKDGFFYVLDRRNGKVISAGKLGKVTWALRIDLRTGRPVEAKNIHYETGEVTIWPSGAGAHNFMSMSFDPQTGLVYVPYMQMGTRFIKGKPQPGGFYVSGLSIKEYKADATDGTGALIAWDPVHQTAAWKVPHENIWNGGAVATAGNLVFQGAADGYLSAYNAATGKRLWRFYVGMGIIAAPMSFAVDGKQYISILAGYGGTVAAFGDTMNVGWKFSSPRRMLTFALDGKAVLPPTPPRDMQVHAVDDPSVKLDPAEVAAGHDLAMACAYCHGRELDAPGAPAPDLRESKIALDPGGLWSVVHDGALLQNGMPMFPQFTREQVMQIYAYIRARARDAMETQKSETAAPAAAH